MKKQTDPIDLRKTSKKRRYVVANRTDAVIYREGRTEDFIFVKRLTNAEGRCTEKELVSDKPGRGFSSAGGGTIHHALGRKSNHHEESAKKFASRISRFLKQSSRQAGYDELILVAEPHFLGLLRAALPLSVQKLVKCSIPREYAQGSDQRLRRLILSAANRTQAH